MDLQKIDNKPSKVDILNSVFRYYEFPSKSKFAEFLGIKPAALNNWYQRNSFVHEILIDKCTELDLHILFRDGRAVSVGHKEKVEDTEHSPSNKSDSLLELIKEKDRQIIQMSERIGQLKEQINHLNANN